MELTVYKSITWVEGRDGEGEGEGDERGKWEEEEEKEREDLPRHSFACQENVWQREVEVYCRQGLHSFVACPPLFPFVLQSLSSTKIIFSTLIQTEEEEEEDKNQRVNQTWYTKPDEGGSCVRQTQPRLPTKSLILPVYWLGRVQLWW